MSAPNGSVPASHVATRARVWPMYQAMVGIALVCGVLIVLAFQWTKPIIERNRAEALEKAIFYVLPEAKSSKTFVLGEDDRFKVLEGKAVYRLNEDWVEVEAGDFMWLRAFCPQACYAGGPGKFRYLLYKDVNRHARLGRW